MFQKYIIILCVLFPNILFSQLQNSSYNSLNLHSSSRVLSMGGDINSIVDDDISLALFVPSLLNEEMDNQIAFNFVDYVSDINFISFHFVKKFNNNLIFSGIDAINYGKFDGRDEIGNTISKFKSYTANCYCRDVKISWE